MSMLGYPVRLDVGQILHLQPYFVYVSSDALVSLRMYSSSPEPQLLSDVIST